MQWVFDSANWRVLIPTERYAPGKPLPPHLSPFVNNEEEGYAPDFAQEIARLQVRKQSLAHANNHWCTRTQILHAQGISL